MSDLIQRLRKDADEREGDWGYRDVPPYVALEREAADELERLQREWHSPAEYDALFMSIVGLQRELAEARRDERERCAKVRPSELEMSATLQVFRRELDKNMDTRHPSASPGHDAMRVALRHLFDQHAAHIRALGNEREGS